MNDSNVIKRCVVQTSATDTHRLPLDRLSALALVYLSLPVLIFSWSWLQWPFAIAMLAMFLTLIVKAITPIVLYPLSENPTKPTTILILAFAGFTWCYFGGAGHFSYANPDWLIRDAVYGDLIRSEWPVTYESHNKEQMILRSAYAYFLVPALGSKLLGIEHADLLLYLWTALGTFIFLCLAPLPRKSIPYLLAALLTVIFFSGMDILGIFISTQMWPIFPMRLEWWVPFSYSSLSGQLFWAPNHTLPLWIATALILRHWRTPELPVFLLALVPVLFLWTPFSPLALLPFLVLGIVTKKMASEPLKLPITLTLASAALCLFFTLFLTIDIDAIPREAGSAYTVTAKQFAENYLLFVVLEFGALALVLAPRVNDEKPTFAVAAVVLLALPLLFFGPSNDLMLRCSVPPLLILLFAALKALQDAQVKREGTHWLIVGILVVGSATPFFEIWRAATWNHWKPNYQKTLIEANRNEVPAHYVARIPGDSYWLKILAPAEARSTAGR